MEYNFNLKKYIIKIKNESHRLQNVLLVEKYFLYLILFNINVF